MCYFCRMINLICGLGYIAHSFPSKTPSFEISWFGGKFLNNVTYRTTLKHINELRPMTYPKTNTPNIITINTTITLQVCVIKGFLLYSIANLTKSHTLSIIAFPLVYKSNRNNSHIYLCLNTQYFVLLVNLMKYWKIIVFYIRKRHL